MTTVTSVSRIPRTPIRRPRAGVTIDPARLAEQRERRAMSRLELAERVGAQLFTAATVAQIEAGHYVPSTRVLQVLYAVLHDTTPRTGQILDPATLREQREQRGWSPGDLAAAVASLLFTRDAIAKIENGTRRPKPSTFRALCDALDCQPDDLLPRRRGGQNHTPVNPAVTSPDGITRPLPAPVDLTPGSPLAFLQGILLNGAWNALDQDGRFTTVGDIAVAERDGTLTSVHNIGARYADNIHHVLSGALPLTPPDEAAGGPGENNERELATVGSVGVSSSGDRADGRPWDEEA